MGNVDVDVAWEDVISVVQMIQSHLIVVGIALVCMIAVIIAAKKWEKPLREMIRWQSVIAFVLITVITLNLALTGTLYNTLNVVLADKGELDPQHVENSKRIIEEVTNEGTVMVKNDDDFLPLEPQKLNVFGWASTNPIFGGTGSGTVDTATAVGILQGLNNAGFETNEELSDMYVKYRADRPIISINDGQDWTLPEVPAADYSDEIMENAKKFSDKAAIVISRTGGEGADLPTDMGPIMDGSTMDIGTKYMKGSYTNNSSEYDDFQAGQSYLELSQTEKDLVDMVCSEFDDVIIIYNGANPLELGWTEDYKQIKSVLLCARAGATGFNALGNIIAGNVKPSGKTTDTWLRDLHQAPYFNNIGHFAYTNTQDVSDAAKEAWERADGIVSFVNYSESIYVGYRFYETADQENLIDYDDTVLYPFGYGLSYTTFEQEMGDIQTLTLEFDVEDMEKLRTDYLDLMLLHQPFGDTYGAWRALEELYREGKLRAIGISNHYADRMVEFANFTSIKPMVNQMETHPLNQQKTLKEWADKYDIRLEAWAPFGEGRNGLFENEVLKAIGQKYGKSTAQVMLR